MFIYVLQLELMSLTETFISYILQILQIGNLMDTHILSMTYKKEL